MKAKGVYFALVAVCLNMTAVSGQGYLEREFGEALPGSTARVRLWWASSGWKVGRGREAPQAQGPAVEIRAARAEAEAAQLVIRPEQDLTNLRMQVTDLTGPGSSVLPAHHIDLLRVAYVQVALPTDDSSVAGYWPDPLPPWRDGITVPAGTNQPIWIRVRVPHEAPAGWYRGQVILRAEGYRAEVALRVEVYDFNLPERMTCVTAFGFSPQQVFKYQNLKDRAQQRAVLDKYWANFSAHHISPYDPAPLDPIRMQWPQIEPPPSPWSTWENLRRVNNESHSGRWAMLLFDDDVQANVTTSYKPLIAIPSGGLRIRFWYRTAIPGHPFNMAMNHYDGNRQWMSGRNRDMTLEGNGRWQEFDVTVTEFPAQARYVRLNARATRWTEAGADIGLVWIDDISLADPETGEESLAHGDFESIPRTEPLRPATELQPRIDFRAWDRAMEQALGRYGFNSFRLGIPGIGSGTFHSRSVPQLLGFTEETPEYPLLFDSTCRQIESHLAEKGWLDEAFVYWFDEPLPKDYDYINNGFRKLKAAAPRIPRMLTVMEGVDERLYGGPDIWCSISNKYDHTIAEARRQVGESFWWYICTGPKAPYCTLFIDHPGTELRVWLWQTWQRNIEGILVWQTNYWTSATAYPDHAQNPYEDPMGWRTGYGTPRGERHPWGNGDGRFIYPPEAAADARPQEPVTEGPVDSLRWEMLRDGIEDYEYLAMLKRLIQRHRSDLTDAQEQRYSALLVVPEDITTDLTHFTQDPAPLARHRDRLARAIMELTVH